MPFLPNEFFLESQSKFGADAKEEGLRFAEAIEFGGHGGSVINRAEDGLGVRMAKNKCLIIVRFARAIHEVARSHLGV